MSLIVGQWGIDAILLGDPDGCLSSSWNTCGRLFTFHSDGTGEVDGRVFTWLLSRNGAPLLTMLDGSGSLEIYAHAAYDDEVFSVLTRTTTEERQYHSTPRQ